MRKRIHGWDGMGLGMKWDGWVGNVLSRPDQEFALTASNRFACDLSLRSAEMKLPPYVNAATLRSMIADEIKELMQAVPFRPVRIVLGSNQSYIVAHTDYLMISPDRQSVILYDQGGHFKILNSQQIKLVEPVTRRSSKAA